jgi:hypothetical protein
MARLGRNEDPGIAKLRPNPLFRIFSVFFLRLHLGGVLRQQPVLPIGNICVAYRPTANGASDHQKSEAFEQGRG